MGAPRSEGESRDFVQGTHNQRLVLPLDPTALTRCTGIGAGRGRRPRPVKPDWAEAPVTRYRMPALFRIPRDGSVAAARDNLADASLPHVPSRARPSRPSHTPPCAMAVRAEQRAETSRGHPAPTAKIARDLSLGRLSRIELSSSVPAPTRSHRNTTPRRRV